jgi:hypothetical protein
MTLTNKVRLKFDTGIRHRNSAPKSGTGIAAGLGESVFGQLIPFWFN